MLFTSKRNFKDHMLHAVVGFFVGAAVMSLLSSKSVEVRTDSKQSLNSFRRLARKKLPKKNKTKSQLSIPFPPYLIWFKLYMCALMWEEVNTFD